MLDGPICDGFRKRNRKILELPPQVLDSKKCLCIRVRDHYIFETPYGAQYACLYHFPVPLCLHHKDEHRSEGVNDAVPLKVCRLL